MNKMLAIVHVNFISVKCVCVFFFNVSHCGSYIRVCVCAPLCVSMCVSVYERQRIIQSVKCPSILDDKCGIENLKWTRGKEDGLGSCEVAVFNRETSNGSD